MPCGSDDKQSACNSEDLGSIPGLGRPRREGNGPLQYPYLENSMDRAAWRAKVHGLTKESDMTEQAHTLTHSCNSSNCKTKEKKNYQLAFPSALTLSNS